MPLLRKYQPNEKVMFQGEEVKFMQFAFVRDLENPKVDRARVHSLWHGHWLKVVTADPIYLTVTGFNGAYKYVHHKDIELLGLHAKLYKHVAERYHPVCIVLHVSVPTVVCGWELIHSPDKPITAVSWTYSASGNHMWCQCAWDDDTRP
eukprot:s839_g40.t1